jgi:hypothetical protein
MRCSGQCCGGCSPRQIPHFWGSLLHSMIASQPCFCTSMQCNLGLPLCIRLSIVALTCNCVSEASVLPFRSFRGHVNFFVCVRDCASFCLPPLLLEFPSRSCSLSVVLLRWLWCFPRLFATVLSCVASATCSLFLSLSGCLFLYLLLGLPVCLVA